MHRQNKTKSIEAITIAAARDNGTGALTYLCTLQIHVIISDLEIYTKHVDEGHIIAT